jgi:AraC-like DNA-binding protein
VDEKGYTRIGEGKTITIATEIHMVGPMMKFTAEQLGLEHVGNDELIELGVKGNYSLKYTTSRSNPELSAFECGRQICDPGYYYGPTKREYYILHYIAKGKGIFEINNNKYFLKANDCFLIPPNVTTFYQADKEDPWTYYWVGFNGIGARPICKKAGFIKNDVYALTPLNPKNIEQRIRVLSEIEPRKGSVEYTMLGHLYLLFAEMVSAQEISNSSHRKDDYIAEAIKLMNENYWHDLSVGYIAKFVGLERTYFYRQFKNAMSISPQDYLINMRLTKAMIMLKDTKLRLGEIAMQVGYVNYISFVKVFKKKYGITPKEYRDHPWETN